MNESISILNSVELLPLDDADINPFLTKVRIKVFHLGENRNHSYIDKATAINMAKTLRGNPIVARYREEDQDFTDHGTEIVINDKGITKNVLTKPYGFVDLNAKVWFEDFNDTDENGHVITHTYLVTEGQVWTEQYQELKNTILDGGRPQSMELDEKTLKGVWSDKINPNWEIFIINDAIITKLCALGEDTEPCFLGASITPEFELAEESFIKELVEFKEKFQFALQKQEGGSSMGNEENVNVPQEEGTEFSENVGTNDELGSSENDVNTEEFTKKDSSEEKDENKDSEDKDKKEPENKEDDSKSDDNDDEDEDKKKKVTENSCHSEEEYELLQTKFDNLQAEFTALQETVSGLKNFKLEVENKQKDELIASFYMLSDEDKKDVLENKANYSLEDIKAKLSVICFDKKVNFNLDREDQNQNQDNAEATKPATTFNLDSHESDALPAWLRAVQNIKDSKQ
jgi:hypothetical protein